MYTLHYANYQTCIQRSVVAQGTKRVLCYNRFVAHCYPCSLNQYIAGIGLQSRSHTHTHTHTHTKPFFQGAADLHFRKCSQKLDCCVQWIQLFLFHLHCSMGRLNRLSIHLCFQIQCNTSLWNRRLNWKKKIMFRQMFTFS